MFDAKGAVKTDPQLFPNLLFAFVLTACAMALQVVLSVPFEVVAAVYAVATKQPPSHPVQHPLVLGLINLVAFGGVIALGIHLAKTPPREILALRRVRGVLLLPILFSTLGAAIVLSEADNVFRWILPMPEFVADLFRSLFSMETSWWGSIFALVLVAPGTEEVLFRGLILRGLLSRHRAHLAILISAALFAFAHLNPWQVVSASALGGLFGWWYHRTHSIVPGLIGHALVNGSVLACGYLPVEITGFNKGEPHAAVEFQPVWFSAAGLVVLAIGIWLFHRWSPKPEKPPQLAYGGPPPPVISPPIAGHSI